MAAIAWWFQRRRGVIRIDENGLFIAKTLSSKPLRLPWNEIDGFGVASVTLIEEGLHQPGSSQYVGVCLNDSSQLKNTRDCADNRKLSDYDLLLTPKFGMTVEHFAAHLEEKKRTFQKS
jgi:hypothetical protein